MRGDHRSWSIILKYILNCCTDLFWDVMCQNIVSCFSLCWYWWLAIFAICNNFVGGPVGDSIQLGLVLLIGPPPPAYACSRSAHTTWTTTKEQWRSCSSAIKDQYMLHCHQRSTLGMNMNILPGVQVIRHRKAMSWRSKECVRVIIKILVSMLWLNGADLQGQSWSVL